MSGKRIYFSNETRRVLNQVFPSEFRIVADPTSKGYKFVNLLYGVEIDMQYDYIDQARHNSNLELFDFGTDHDYYQVIIKNNIVNDTVYDADKIIKITDAATFYDGPPTRMETTGTLRISGVSWGPVGLEYFRTEPEGSGYILVNLDIDSSEAYTAGQYQSFRMFSDDVGNFSWPVSGVHLGLQDQKFEDTGFDEVLIPKTQRELTDSYPMTKQIWAPQSGVAGRPKEQFTIDHYTPDNGYYWDPVAKTYKARGYDSDFYFDENDERVYYRTGFNNPYGTGVYTTVYIDLINTPVSGTLALYDLDNLISGHLIEIPQSGINTYYHSGVYGTNHLAYYIGYESMVPYEYLPIEESGLIQATLYKNTSWDYCRESGGLNDNFQWQEYPNNQLTNRIKIVNPISRYLVMYKYETSKKNKYISSLNSTKYIRQHDNNYLFSAQTNSNNEIPVYGTLSKEVSNRKAITYDSMEIRPGSTINRLELTTDVVVQGGELRDSNTTLSLDRLQAGYSDKIYPNKTNHCAYLLNENFRDTDLTLTNTDGTVTTIPYDTVTGIRFAYPSGTMYYSSGTFYDLVTSSDDVNRFVRVAFKFNRPAGNIINLVSSTDGSGLFWNMYIDSDRSVVIKDTVGIYKSYEQLLNTTLDKELILERDMLYEAGPAEYEWGVYYREGDSVFKQFGLQRVYVDNNVPSGYITKFFENSSVDMKYIQIYEEPREFTDV